MSSKRHTVWTLSPSLQHCFEGNIEPWWAGTWLREAGHWGWVLENYSPVSASCFLVFYDVTPLLCATATMNTSSLSQSRLYHSWPLTSDSKHTSPSIKGFCQVLGDSNAAVNNRVRDIETPGFHSFFSPEGHEDFRGPWILGCEKDYTCQRI